MEVLEGRRLIGAELVEPGRRVFSLTLAYSSALVYFTVVRCDVVYGAFWV